MSSSSRPETETPVYPPFYSKTSLIQIGYGLWVNLVMVSFGLATGFSAVAVPQLESVNKMKLSICEASWITSVISLTQPMGCLIAGFMTDRYGRRLVLILGQIPTALGWLYIAMAGSPNQVIVGRVIKGIGVGMAMGPPRTYVTEITLPNMRGVVGAFSNLAISFGIIVQAELASLFGLKVICLVCGCYCFLLTIGNLFLPESPYYVLMKDDVTKARVSLMKFRDKNYPIDKEMASLIQFKQRSDLRRLSWKERMRAIFKLNACKPFCLLMTFVMFAQLSGIGITTYWTVTLLQESMSSVNAYTGNVVLASTRFVAGFIAIILLYRVGKRPLAFISSIGSSGSYIVLGIYLKYATERAIYPQLLYQCFLLFASFGYFSLPFLMMYELYPLQIRGLLGGISVSTASLMIFVANKSYPYIRQSVSLSIIILIFGINSIIGTLYLYLFLPETKNRTLQELEKLYSEKGSLLASRLIKTKPRVDKSGNNTNGNTPVDSTGGTVRNKVNDDEVESPRR